MRFAFLILIAAPLVCIAPVARGDEPAFEAAPVVTATDLLTAAERKGPNHTVAEAVGTLRFMHTFRVESTYGRYDVVSKRLLDTRLREIQTMARVVGMDEVPEFLRSLGGRLAQIPTAAVEIIVQPRDSFEKMGAELERSFERFKDLFKSRKGSEYEDSKLRGALIGTEKRRLAAQLGLDVYSTNPKVQQFLNDIATARAAGAAGVDLASYALPIVGYLAVSTARLRADVARLLRDKTPSELARYNDKRLTELGISAPQRAILLEQAWLSPRHQTVITAAVREMAGVKGLEAVVRAAGLARNEVGALYHEQQAVMLAQFHTEMQPLVQLEAVEHIVLARTNTDAVMVILPVDQVYASEPFLKFAKTWRERPIAKDATAFRILVTGRVTSRAKAALGDLGMDLGTGYKPKAKAR
jgi:hypothetical protein